MSAKLERSLIDQLVMICRAARTVDISHEAFARPIANLHETLKQRGAPYAFELDTTGVVLAGGIRHVHDNAEWLALALERGRARRIVIDEELAEADLRELLRAMIGALEFREIASSLASSGARGIRVDSLLVS